ncbi:hypothetical protein [Rhizobium yanglingense]
MPALSASGLGNVAAFCGSGFGFSGSAVATRSSGLPSACAG